MPTTPAGREPELLQMYWEQQWARNAEFETQRLEVSNIVIGSSTIALGLLVAANDASLLAAGVVAGLVGAMNLVAAAYCTMSLHWARYHRARAALVLSDNWPYLAQVESSVIQDRPADGRLRRDQLHRLLHYLLALCAVLLVLGFCIGRASADEQPPRSNTTTTTTNP